MYLLNRTFAYTIQKINRVSCGAFRQIKMKLDRRYNIIINKRSVGEIKRLFRRFGVYEDKFMHKQKYAGGKQKQATHLKKPV